MHETTLWIRDDRTISFNGALIARQSTTVRFSETADVVLTLSLYAVSGGGFVPLVEFRSSSDIVQDVVDAEQVDLVKDVECFFLLFEPTEHIDFRVDANCSPAPNAERQMCNELMRKYYLLTNNLLDALADYRTVDPSCELIHVSRPNELSRIWDFFGLGRE